VDALEKIAAAKMACSGAQSCTCEQCWPEGWSEQREAREALARIKGGGT